MDFAAEPAENDTETDRRDVDASYYRGILHEMIDMGADLARRVHRQVTSQGDDAVPDAEAVVAFERVSRIVRRSILLAQRLDEPVRARRQSARRQIIRGVEDAIQREASGEVAESLHAEFLERLDGPDLDADIGDRPAGEIIAELCRDLGLGAMPGTHPWKRRRPAEVAALCARAAGLAARVPVGYPAGGQAPDAKPRRLHSPAGCRGP